MNEWSNLTDQQQSVYLNKANYLMGNGYVNGDLYVVAERIYCGERQDIINSINEKENAPTFSPSKQ